MKRKQQMVSILGAKHVGTCQQLKHSLGLRGEYNFHMRKLYAFHSLGKKASKTCMPVGAQALVFTPFKTAHRNTLVSKKLLQRRWYLRYCILTFRGPGDFLNRSLRLTLQLKLSEIKMHSARTVIIKNTQYSKIALRGSKGPCNFLNCDFLNTSGSVPVPADA